MSTNTDTARYGWEGEAWYKAQTHRWDALEAQGWQFGRPEGVVNRVGISIFRNGALRYTWHVPKDRPAEEIHTDLLEKCERYARDHADD